MGRKDKTKPKRGAKPMPTPKSEPMPDPVPVPIPISAPPVVEAHPGQSEKQVIDGIQDAHQEKDALPPLEPQTEQPSPSPDFLPVIRKVLEDHMLMEYLSDCEFRLDASTAKHGDIYRLYVDDFPTDMAIVWNGGRFTVDNKTHATPSDAAWAICNDMLAKVRAAKRK